jgi:hypothetical protein
LKKWKNLVPQSTQIAHPERQRISVKENWGFGLKWSTHASSSAIRQFVCFSGVT